jgi:hypothetical protein
VNEGRAGMSTGFGRVSIGGEGDGEGWFDTPRFSTGCVDVRGCCGLTELDE